ncbi:MAG TPA: hypothetical protein VK119_03555 [Bacillota bacterium]|nr:hypothetical protein [Bacillota bacterium]
MLFSFMYYLAKQDPSVKESHFDKMAFYMFTMMGVSGAFLTGLFVSHDRWATPPLE